MFQLEARLEKLLFDIPRQPGHPAWARVSRVLRYPFGLLRDLWHGGLNLRAMGLVYTTLLSIVPLLAFAFAVFKGMNVHRELEPLIYEFFRPIGGNATELTARVMGFVENISSGVLGSLGLAFLLYSVVSMVQKIEESLNFVWHVERPRSFARRVSEYLSLMVVGPIVVVATFGLMTTAANSAVMRSITALQPFGMLLAFSGRLAPYVIVSAFFTFLYMFIPNTRVRFVPALAGGLVAGLLWVAVGAAFTAFVGYMTNLTLVYASFAILLTALIWIYVAWLVLLIGAQLSFYVQNPAVPASRPAGDPHHRQSRRATRAQRDGADRPELPRRRAGLDDGPAGVPSRGAERPAGHRHPFARIRRPHRRHRGRAAAPRTGHVRDRPEPDRRLRAPSPRG